MELQYYNSPWPCLNKGQSLHFTQVEQEIIEVNNMDYGYTVYQSKKQNLISVNKLTAFSFIHCSHP